MSFQIPEHWKPIPGLADYEASSEGRIQRVTPGRNTAAGYIVRQTNQRYRMVRLFDKTGILTVQVHRLVALAFHGKPQDGMQVAHNDGDPHNNRADNLRWDTAKNNCADRKRHGTQPRLAGEKNGACVYSDKVIQRIVKARISGASFASISKQTGVSTSQVFRICSGKSRQSSVNS